MVEIDSKSDNQTESTETNAQDEAEAKAGPPPRPEPTIPPSGMGAGGAGEGEFGKNDDTSLPEAVRQKLEAWLPELVKRAFSVGFGAVSTTEESIRRITKEIPLPKEVAGYLVNTASTTKDELMRVMAREVREFLQNVNISEEIAKILTTLSFEVKTEIRFIPNSEKYGGVEPDVSTNVRLKKNDTTPPAGERLSRFRRKTGRQDPE